MTEVDPICALQAAMDGFEVTTLDEALPFADFVITATGNRDIVTVDHMQIDEAPGRPRQHRPLR